MSWLYKIKDATIKICNNREIIHYGQHRHFNQRTWMSVERENEIRSQMCPYTVTLLSQEEESNAYFKFIKQETTGLWYRTGGIIFHFEKEVDAVGFRLRF